ncbi:MAG: protein-L-isoaspartate O-methyltransferase [Anaerolineales bacterium]|nr:protein-L-isoaspartate O-methyltransferase [Anaerolineales bacterium]
MALARISKVMVCFGLLTGGCAAPPTPAPTPPASPTVAVRPAMEASPAPAENPFTQARLEMVRDTIEARGVTGTDVLRVMRTVPRHVFVPHGYLNEAYADHPLPIGYGQTISQPYIVAWMTAGSGYQAAVLAELGYVEVYSIEIIPELAGQAADRLRALDYTKIQLKQGDGYYGWEEHAPFNAIIVTAAPDHLPSPLAAQLADGGRLVIPIGPPGGYQSLWKFVKQGEDLKAYDMGGVAFVPFTGGGMEGDAPAATSSP